MVTYYKVPEYVYKVLAGVDLGREKACNEHLEDIILGGERPKCPACGSDKLYVDKTHLGIYKCKRQECRYGFSAYRNTFLHGTKVPFRKWLALICTYYKFGMEFKITVRAYAVGLGLTSPTINLMLEKIKNDSRADKLAPKIFSATNVSTMRHYLDDAWSRLDERVKTEKLRSRKRSE